MAEKTLSEVLKSIKKSYGESIVQTGIKNSFEGNTFSLGSPGLDFITYNSIPRGVFIECSGQEGSGKTTLAYLIAADYIKKELKKPEDKRQHILYIDTECTANNTKGWALRATGYDMDREDVQTILIQPEGQTAEQIFDMCREFASTGEIGLIIFDSLTVLASQQIMEESFEKKQMGGIALALGDFVKRCTGLFHKYGVTFIGINGTTTNISGYGNPETTSGGTHWKRACSLRLKVKRGDFFDQDMNILKSTAESPAGHIIQVAVQKTKFCRWDRKLGQTYLNYTSGIDLIQDTVEVATHLNLIDNSTQGIFKLIDPDTGEVMIDEDGKELKIRGKKNVKPWLKEHKEVFTKLYNKVYEELSKQDKTNVQTFEELLGLNVIEEFNLSTNE